MSKFLKIILLTGCFLSIGFSVIFAEEVAESEIVINSVLNGTVDSVPQVGDTLKEGDSALSIKTLVATAVAARAKCEGSVLEVYVKKGDPVKPGQPVLKMKGSKPPCM